MALCPRCAKMPPRIQRARFPDINSYLLDVRYARHWRLAPGGERETSYRQRDTPLPGAGEGLRHSGSHLAANAGLRCFSSDAAALCNTSHLDPLASPRFGLPATASVPHGHPPAELRDFNAQFHEFGRCHFFGAVRGLLSIPAQCLSFRDAAPRVLFVHFWCLCRCLRGGRGGREIFSSFAYSIKFTNHEFGIHSSPTYQQGAHQQSTWPPRHAGWSSHLRSLSTLRPVNSL